MEADRREVPLYGQVEACVRSPAGAPADAEFYVVVEGSRMTHVTAAKPADDGLNLRYTVPGHDLAEVASVTPYLHTDNGAEPCEGGASLRYLRDIAQEAAEYLSAHWEQLGPHSCREALERFSGEEPGDGDKCGLKTLDEKITRALANLEYTQPWKNPDDAPQEANGRRPRETLLHLAVRLDLLHLARFLVGRPGGRRALTSPNEDGETPVQLAERSGRRAAVELLTASSSGPAAAAVRSVWSDASRVLRFCPATDALTLSVRRRPGATPRDTIAALRERLEDRNVLDLIDVLRGGTEKDERDGRREETNVDGGGQELHVDEHVLVDNVFEEQLVLSLDDDDDNDGGQEEAPSTLEDPPLSTNHSCDHEITQPSQLDDVDIKYRVSGVTRDSSGTDAAPVDTMDLLLVRDSPPPFPGDSDPPSGRHSPPLSPLDQALIRLNRPAVPEPTTDEGDVPPADTCDLSLVSLEVDSEEDAVETKASPDVDGSDDRSESARPASNRSQSASACEPAKEAGQQGIRWRSYSYSSSKISLRAARFARDNQAPDTNPEQRASAVSDHTHQKRDISFRKRAQSADDEGGVELPESLQHLTLSEFLKEIEEEELLDKYSAPTRTESEKYKVIRTFSFLKSRMSSTRSKTKGKGKDRDAKDRPAGGHRFSSGPCLGPTVCVVCDRPATGKDLLHCSGCTAIVHKGCKESVPPCLKKLQDKYAVTNVKNRTASLPQNFTVRDSPPPPAAFPVSTSLPAMTPKERKDAASSPLSGSFPGTESRLGESSEAEPDFLKPAGQSEELLPTPVSSTSTDSSFGEDCVDACVHGDIAADSADYEAESWSLAVEHKFCKKQDKRAVKRQDVIYELMQTELHHLQTLHIMAEVFRRGMKEEVQLDTEAVERVFPCLDQLLLLHHDFFAAAKERRRVSAQPEGHRNYLIRRIGDVLLRQFSDENGEKMKRVYGEFCSHHNEAVSFFKELQQHNKRFQSFIKQQGSNSLVRRKEIPGCILLVTQRITKYPVLLERILQYTQEGTEEHADLSRALAEIREVIAAVDLRVSEYERHQRLREVWGRMENRSAAKLKNGRTFRKQDVMGPGQTLQHQGPLLWKTATGRLKDVLALLLTDTLIFLQEKDQKYIFATVDQKPPVIALQKLIVREVANEEKGMFLISASAAGPEMYEVHTASKDERNAWMRLIREAVENCPEEEEEYAASESEEEKRAAEARFHKIQKLQESLWSQDQQICSGLEEKLQIYAALCALSGRNAAPLLRPRLLVQPLAEELPQAAVLLTAALQEAENLKASLSSKTGSPSGPGRDSDWGSAESAESGPDPAEGNSPEPADSQNAARSPKSDATDDVDLKVVQSVQNLTQLLYSLQAAVTIQDSCYEVQRLLLQEGGRPSPHAQRLHLPLHPPTGPRGNSLQEQEKQRNLEKQKEEVASVQRLQERLRQEKERWERQRQARDSQQGELESRLEERERRCQLAAEKLRRERDELDEQLEDYQQSLERLREGQRSVERERHRLDEQRRLLQSWTHGRQGGLPAVAPHLLIQDGDRAANGSAFVNEAALAGANVNNRHVRQKRNADASAHNCLNALLARSTGRAPPAAKTPRGREARTGYICSPAGGDDHSFNGDSWSSPASSADPFPALPHPGDPRLDLSALVSLETGGREEEEEEEEGREETIVYL